MFTLFFNNFLLVTILITAIFTSGCSEPTNNSTIRMGLASAPIDLDPRRATDAASTRINRLIYQRLVEFDAANLPVPALAKWTQVTPTTYRFHLHLPPQQRTFSNGQVLIAEDVRATLASILDPATGSPYRTQIAAINNLKVLDQDTLEIGIAQPDPLFPTRLVLDILPAKLIMSNHPFHNQPIGSGAFKLHAWPQTGKLQLVRRSDQQMLEFLEVKEPGVRVMKLMRGEINLLQSDLPPELFRFLRDRPKIQVLETAGSNFTYIGLHMQDPALKQLVIRQAIAYAIDRDAIIQYLLAGGARSAQSLFPSQHWAGAKDLSPFMHNLAQARRLLEQAGYNLNHPLELSYKTSTDPFRIRLATVIQAQLKAAGINLKVQSLDWGTFYGDIKAGKFQLYSLTWVGIKTPDHFRAIVHSTATPPQGSNRGHYHNPKVDTLLDRIAQLPTLEAQAIAYKELQHILLADLPYIPLWYENQIAAIGDDIQGYRPAKDGNWDALTHITKVNLIQHKAVRSTPQQ
jgi:peptide/nickel transport system substrate-binding protein